MQRYAIAETVFWCAVVLGVMPSVLSNALLPFNWFVPLFVKSVGWVFFGPAVKPLVAALFCLGTMYCLFKRSPLRLIAILPLAMIWVYPVDVVHIDLSRSTTAAAFQARADWLARTNVTKFVPVESRKTLTPEQQKSLTQLDEMIDAYRVVGKSNGWLQTAINQQLEQIRLEREARETLYAAINLGTKPPITGPLPETDIIEAALSQKIRLPVPVPGYLRPSGLDAFRAEALAELAAGTAASRVSALNKSLAITEFNLLGEAGFYSMVLSTLSLISIILFAVIGRGRVVLTLAVSLTGGVYAFQTSLINPAFSTLQTLFLILLVVVLHRMWQENRGFLSALGRPKNLANLGRTLGAWSLFLALFASSIYASMQMSTVFTRVIYQVQVPPYVSPDLAWFHIHESGAGLEADLLLASEAHYQHLNAQTRDVVKSFRVDYRKDASSAVDVTMARLERTIRPVIFTEYAHCLKPPDLACPVVNSVKFSINRSYFNARRAQLGAIRLELISLSKLGGGTIDTAASEVQARIDEATRTASNWTRTGISRTFLLYAILNTLSIAFLVFVLIKSFAFIASRVYLHADPENEEMWEQFAKPQTGNVPTPQENSFTFSREEWGVFFTRRNQSNKNIKRDTTWPQLGAMLLRRMATRSLAFYREDWSRDQGEKTVRNTKGGQFVAWRLAEGQKIVFSLRNLSAFSETITLRTLWSFRLSHFIFGRTLFSSAEGPGMILLSTQGEPHIGQPGERFTFGASPAEYIAFDLNADFLVLSDLKLKNIYFSDIEVVANDASRAVVDVIPDVSLAGGAAKFIRAFFIPV